MTDQKQEKRYTEEELNAARARERYQAEVERIDASRNNIFGISLILIILLMVMNGAGIVLSGVVGTAVGWGIASWYHSSEMKKLGAGT